MSSTPSFIQSSHAFEMSSSVITYNLIWTLKHPGDVQCTLPVWKPHWSTDLVHRWVGSGWLSCSRNLGTLAGDLNKLFIPQKRKKRAFLCLASPQNCQTMQSCMEPRTLGDESFQPASTWLSALQATLICTQQSQLLGLRYPQAVNYHLG